MNMKWDSIGINDWPRSFWWSFLVIKCLSRVCTCLSRVCNQIKLKPIIKKASEIKIETIYENEGKNCFEGFFVELCLKSYDRWMAVRSLKKHWNPSLDRIFDLIRIGMKFILNDEIPKTNQTNETLFKFQFFYYYY